MVLSWWLILLLLIYFGVIFMLIGIILIQSGKGGGLSSLAQASGGIGDAIGATGAEKTLNKLTTYIAVAFIVMAMAISLLSSARGTKQSASEILGGTAAPAQPIEGSVPPPPPTGEETGATAPVEPRADILQAIPPAPPAEAAMPPPPPMPADSQPADASAPAEAPANP